MCWHHWRHIRGIVEQRNVFLEGQITEYTCGGTKDYLLYSWVHVLFMYPVMLV